MQISCYTRKRFSCIILMFILLFLLSGTQVLADSPLGGLKTAADQAGINTSNHIGLTLGKVFKQVLGIMGLLLLILFVVGGIMWMTSGGSPEKLKKAQGLLVNAIIGLIIVLCSYAIVDFVTTKLTSVTT